MVREEDQKTVKLFPQVSPRPGKKLFLISRTPGALRGRRLLRSRQTPCFFRCGKPCTLPEVFPALTVIVVFRVLDPARFRSTMLSRREPGDRSRCTPFSSPSIYTGSPGGDVVMDRAPYSPCGMGVVCPGAPSR